MFIKHAKMKIEASSVIDRDILLFGSNKKAFIKHDISENLVHASNSLDIVAELKEREPSEWVIFRARAIDAGGSDKSNKIYHGANDNGDYFSEEELLSEYEKTGLKSYETFINVPLFTNHQNGDIEKARGKVVASFYDLENHCIYTDCLVDAKAHPSLARGIREGYINDVSMGCSVKWSECSVCGNKAVNEKDYCKCIKNHKGKMVQGQKAYEKNHGVKFIELSAVTDGACENCTIQNAYSGDEFLKKLEDNVCGIVLKACGETKDCLFKYKKASLRTSLIKEARGEDVDKLNKALDNLREVADQILNSKAVDFEFLEKIGSLLADLQELIVDLVEAGFANEANGEGKEESATPMPAKTPTPPVPPPGAAGIPPAPTPPAPGMLSNQSQITADVRENIKMNKNNSKDLEELYKTSLKIKEIVNGIAILKQNIAGGIDNMPTKKQLNRMSTSNTISEKFAEILDERLSENDPIVISDGSYSIKIDPQNGISGFIDNKLVVEASNEELGDDLVVMAKINPQVVAGRLIQVLYSKYNENGELKMNKGAAKNENIIREALITNAPPVKEVQEGQLNNLDGNFDRKNDPVKADGQVGAITEKQLDNVPKSKETGKGDWNRIRPAGVKENLTVTEGQLDDSRPTDFGSDRKHSSAAPAKDQLGMVQEGQFASYNDAKDGGSSGRWHDEMTPGDYIPITEAQFEGKDRLGKAVDELQEGQLENYRQGDSKFSGPSDASPHRASKEENIVTAIINGLSNAVLARRISAKSLVNAKAGLVAPKNKISDYRFAGKTNWSIDEIRAVAQAAIVEELKNVGTFGDQEVDDALTAVYEVPETLEASLTNSIQKKIAELSNIQDIKTVEENKKDSYINALKKSALKKEASLVHLSPGNLRQLLGNGFSLNKLKDTDLEAVLSKMNPGVDFFDFSKAADGGWNIHSTKEINDLNLIGQENTNKPQQNIDMNMNNNGIDVPSMDSTQMQNSNIGTEPMPIAASKVAALKKLAQSPAGTTLPPPGGAPAAGGPPPMGGAPGMESLTTTPPADDTLGGDEDLEDEDTDGEPKPFGSICPKCGSEDVDEIEGSSKCNNCGTEFETEINIKILNEEGPEGEEEESEEMEPTEGENINEELEAPAAAAGGAAPGGVGAPPPPGGAGGGLPGLAYNNAWLKTSYKIDPFIFVKNSPFRFASIGKEVSPGHRCISCGTTRVAFKDSKGLCLKCGNKYSVTVSKSGKNVTASIYWTPNLVLKTEPTIIVAKDGRKLNLGYATKGEVIGASDVKKILHEILSSRDNMIKTASTAQNTGTFDDMIVCQLDQCGRGYASDEARIICASIKDGVVSKFAQVDEDDSNDDDDENDNVEFEEDNIDDSNDEMQDDDEMEEITDEDEDYDSEMEEEEILEDEPIDDVPGEMGGHSDAPNVQKIELYMEDKDGNEFEVEYDVSGIEPTTVEGPDDFDQSADEEIEEDHELGNDMTDTFSDEIGDEDTDEVIIEEEIDDPGFSIKDLFSPKEEEADLLESPKKEIPMDESSVMSLASQTSELLRGNRVTSSNRIGGSNIDINKVAQFLGITMPNDTQADVPRNKEQGIREDGEVVSTHDHPNTAKKMADGKHRGNAYTDQDQAIDRGVETIVPKSGRHASKKTAAGCDCVKDGECTCGTDCKCGDACTCVDCKGKKASNKNMTKKAVMLMRLLDLLSSEIESMKSNAIERLNAGEDQTEIIDDLARQFNENFPGGANESYFKNVINKTLNEAKGTETTTQASNKNMTKKAEEKTIKPTPSGNDMNHTSPDGSDQTPNNKGMKNEEKKGDGKVKEKSNSSKPTPAGDDDNHAVATSRIEIKEAGKKCPTCRKSMKKCSCGMMKKKTKLETKKDKKKASNGNWMKVSQNQSQRQTEPVDAISDGKKLPMSADSEQKLDIPRNKSKAKPETKFERPKGVDSPVEVRKKDYSFGQPGKNLHTEVVPRDGSGDGVGGKSVTFKDEKGVDATSRNPDTYVQKWQKNIKPTPSGNEDNHATMGPNTASDRVKIRKISKKINL